MIRKALITPKTVSGLRMRYKPKSRIGQGFVSLAPWMDVVLILVFFAIMESRFVLQPGIVVDLPEAPFTNGLNSDLIAVVLSVPSQKPGRREEIVFFDDNPFHVGADAQMERLQSALARRADNDKKGGLVIEADAAVTQGTMMRLMEIARRAGIGRVNIASREENLNP